MSFEEAANDISLGKFGKWPDRERIVVNMYSLFKEYQGITEHPDMMKLFGLMGKYRAKHAGHDQCGHNH